MRKIRGRRRVLREGQLLDKWSLQLSASAALGAMEQVNYGYFNNTPGTFTSQPLVGTPVLNATAFALPGSDTLTIGGYFTAKVDPASITITTVPEPGVALLCAPAALALLAGCRRRHAVGKE